MTKQTVASKEEKDLIVSFLSAVVRFCKNHKKGVLTALAILVLAAVVGSVYTAHVKKVTEESWAGYYTAQVTLLSGDQAKSFAVIDEVAQNYKGTDAAEYALLLKGDTLYAQDNFAQAADVYAQLLSASNNTVRTVAALSFAATKQAVKEYHVAAEGMNDFIKNNPTSFALPQAYFTLAISQELADNKNEALNAYKHLADAYGNTYFGIVAKEKMTQLQK